MSLSQQEVFVNLIKDPPGFFISLGIGNGQGEYCADNTPWLEEIGWKGVGFELDSEMCRQARVFRPNTVIIEGDCFAYDWQKLFDYLNVPKVVDYISADLDGYSLQGLQKFLETDRDFSILHIEHDLYVEPGGAYRKHLLTEFMKDKPKYKLVAEDVPLVFASQNYLENWYLNLESEYTIPEIKDMYWYKTNPNNIIFDLCRMKKW